MKKRLISLREKLKSHCRILYPALDEQELAEQLIALMELDSHCQKPKAHQNNWSQKDVIAISYGDSTDSAE